jgi:hypothetical protein
MCPAQIRENRNSVACAALAARIAEAICTALPSFHPSPSGEAVPLRPAISR